MKQETINEVAERLVKEHPDFKLEGYTEYQNGRFNGIIEGIEWQQEQDKNKYSEVHIFAFINYINDNYFKDGDGWNPKYKDDWLTTKEIFEIFKQQAQ